MEISFFMKKIIHRSNNSWLTIAFLEFFFFIFLEFLYPLYLWQGEILILNEINISLKNKCKFKLWAYD